MLQPLSRANGTAGGTGRPQRGSVMLSKPSAACQLALSSMRGAAHPCSGDEEPGAPAAALWPVTSPARELKHPQDFT